MQTVALSAVPNQSLTSVVDGQYVTIELRTLETGIYFSLVKNNIPIVQSVLCLNGVKLVRDTYRDYIGDFLFIDMEGNADPVYSGLGGRFQLVAV